VSVAEGVCQNNGFFNESLLEKLILNDPECQKFKNESEKKVFYDRDLKISLVVYYKKDKNIFVEEINSYDD
jgi:hypothetical protein